MNKQILTKTIKPTTAMAKAKRLFELQSIMNEIKPEIDALREELLIVMQVNDTYTLRTKTYTLSRGTRVTPHIADFETLCKALDKRNIPYETITAFSKNMLPVFKSLIEDGEEPEGLEGKVTEYVSVRLAKPKKGKK